MHLVMHFLVKEPTPPHAYACKRGQSSHNQSFNFNHHKGYRLCHLSTVKNSSGVCDGNRIQICSIFCTKSRVRPCNFFKFSKPLTNWVHAPQRPRPRQSTDTHPYQISDFYPNQTLCLLFLLLFQIHFKSLHSFPGFVHNPFHRTSYIPNRVSYLMLPEKVQTPFSGPFAYTFPRTRIFFKNKILMTVATKLSVYSFISNLGISPLEGVVSNEVRAKG